MHEIHDAPKHTIWSSRGDLALGAGTHFRIFPGYCNDKPPPEPWELKGYAEDDVGHVGTTSHQDDGSRPQSHDGNDVRRTARQPRRDDSNSGLRASSLITAKMSEGRTFSPATIRRYTLDTGSPLPPGREAERSGSDSAGMPAKGTANVPGVSLNDKRTDKSPRQIRGGSVLGGRIRNFSKSAPSIIETDISMIMRSRVLRGYGLFCVSLQVPAPDNCFLILSSV